MNVKTYSKSTRSTTKWITATKASFIAAVLSVVVSTILGLLLVWDRGLYMDDYFFKATYLDLSTGSWRFSLTPLFPYVRILGQLVQQNFTLAVPSYELPVRILWAIVHVINVFITGLIAYRITGSRVVGLLTIWFYIMPFWAAEVLLWFGQGSQHPIGTFLFLLSLYLMIDIIRVKDRWQLKLLGALICVALALQFSELAFPAVVFVPLLALVMIISRQSSYSWYRTLLLSIGLSLLGILVILTHYKLFTSNYVNQGYRGGSVTFNLSSIQTNYNIYVQRLYFMILDPNWGLQATKEAFTLGLSTITTYTIGISLLLLLFASSITCIISFPIEHTNIKKMLQVGLVTAAIGLIWATGALLPGTLLSGQLLEHRMLYFAIAGLSIMSASIISAAIVLLQKFWYLQRLFLLIAAGVMVFATIVMVGYSQVFKQRYLYDTKQITELQSVIRKETLSDNTVFIPINPDIHVISDYRMPLTVLDRFLVGIFEVTNPCEGALRMAYQRNDISCIARNHWLPPIEVGLISDKNGGAKQLLQVEQQQLNLDQVITFTYRDDQVVLLSPLLVTSKDGNVIQSIDIPLVQSYKQRGVTTEPMYVAPLN